MHVLLLALMPVALIGCVPLQQSSFVGGKEGDRFAYFDTYGLLTVGHRGSRKEIKVLAKDSYAVSPNGTRHEIKNEDHGYDIEAKHSYIRDQIKIYGTNGRRKRRLSEGQWFFVFKIKTKRGLETRRFGGRVYNVLYIPFIHGPPN